MGKNYENQGDENLNVGAQNSMNSLLNSRSEENLALPINVLPRTRLILLSYKVYCKRTLALIAILHAWLTFLKYIPAYSCI